MKLIFLSFSLLVMSSCQDTAMLTGKINVIIKNQSPPEIIRVKIENDQLIVTGHHLDKVTTAKIAGSINHQFQIESKNESKLVLNAKSALSILAGQTLNLIVSNANAAASFPITFELSSMGASAGQYLRYNGAAWSPASITNTQIFAGSYDATTDTPDIVGLGGTAGSYYIVTVAGTQDFGLGPETLYVGDWVIFNGSHWIRLEASIQGVASFNGRTGLVIPLSGDYSWSMLTKAAGKLAGSKLSEIEDVDVTSIQDGDILQWNTGTSKWEVAPMPILTIPNGSILDTDISATASIAQSKIAGLAASLAGKEPTIPSGTVNDYIRGNKTVASFSSSVLTTLLSGYSSGVALPITPLDTINQALGKLEARDAALATIQGSYVPLNGTGVMSGDFQMGNHLITGLATPSGDDHAATKKYVDDALAGNLNPVRLTSDSGNIVELKAPNALAASLALSFPGNNGTSGQALITDGAGNLSWGSVSSNSIVDADIAAGAAISQSKISGLTSSLAGKEAALTNGTISQYLRGDKTWGSLQADVQSLVMNGYAVGTNSALSNVDTLQSALGKVQGQLNALATSDSSFLIKNGADTISGTISVTGALKIPAAPSGADLTDVANVQFVQNFVGLFGKWAKSGSNISFTGGSVGIGTATPNPSATLDIDSVTGGLLTPRMTMVQRDAIASPAAGLVIYNTSNNRHEFYTGSSWQLLGATGSAVSPPGQVTSFSMNTCPGGWLEANGSAVSRTTYSSLFSAIGTTFGVGNGTTTFNLPDLRGEFVRGWDNGRGADTARVFGSWQEASVLTGTASYGGNIDYVKTGDNYGNGNYSKYEQSNIATYNYPLYRQRPRNVALIYCVSTSTVTATTIANTGSGTIGYHAVWNSTTGLGNSLIYETGGNVGIGTTTPGQKLTVAGVIESTSGGIKYPDGTVQVTASSAVTWTSLGLTSLGAVSLTSTAEQAFNLPGATATAKEISVYFRCLTGASSSSGSADIRVYTKDGSNFYDQYLFVSTWAGQNAISYNSQNFWLPKTSDNKVYLQFSSVLGATNNSCMFYITGYR